MNSELVEKVYKILEAIPKNKSNKGKIEEIEKLLENEEVEKAVFEIKKLQEKRDEIEEEKEESEEEKIEEQYEIESDQIYPKALINEELEENYIGLLLNDPKSISMYYFLYEENYFADSELLNLYKVFQKQNI